MAETTRKRVGPVLIVSYEPKFAMTKVEKIKKGSVLIVNYPIRISKPDSKVKKLSK